jgi:type IV pilus assembly protein PilV
MNKMARPLRAQQGSMLLEALIAILIFSMGVLAIVGLQATSIKLAADAKYRSDASLLANQLLGQMWASNRTATVLQTNFASPSGALYTAWANSVQSAVPGATGANMPVVTVDTTAGANLGKVQITISWQGPSEATAHNYVAIAQIQ